MAHPKALQWAERAGKFLLDELWVAGLGGASRFRRGLVTLTRVTFITLEGFWADLCLLRASALTYASMLGLVPILAIAFALLRGMGWRGDRLEELILSKVTVLSPEAIRLIVGYIDNTSIAGVGIVGGVFLLATFISVMANIEASFNAIWGDVRPRTLMRKVGDYLGVMVTAPLLLALATSFNAALASNAFVEWIAGMSVAGITASTVMGYATYTVVWVVFGFIYMFMPNTKVRLFPAVVGGIVGGSLWLLTQWAYIAFQVGMVRYNAIYGALAQLPILMVWIYVSWVVVLLGAELSYAMQNVGHYRRERVFKSDTYAAREYLGLRIVTALSESSCHHTPAPTIDELAGRFEVPTGAVTAVIEKLADAGVVRLAGEDGAQCFLGYAPDSITLDWVIELLRGDGELATDLMAEGDRVPAAEVMTQLAEGRRQALASRTVDSLVRR